MCTLSFCIGTKYSTSRHAKETAALTAEADLAKSRSEQLETENGKLGARLASALADYEQSVKEKLAEVAGLQAQLNSARREASGVEMGKEVERMRGELRSTGRQLEEEREARRRAELRSEQLRADLGGMEALVNNGNTGEDDSMVQLGLSGATEAAGASSSSLRIREELHRSLVKLFRLNLIGTDHHQVGNRTKREEISKLEAACNRLENNLRVKEAEVSILLNLVLIAFPNIIIILLVSNKSGCGFRINLTTVSISRYRKQQKVRKRYDFKLTTCKLRWGLIHNVLPEP